MDCLPDELDRQDDARLQEILILLAARSKRERRDAARQRAMQNVNARGD